MYTMKKKAAGSHYLATSKVRTYHSILSTRHAAIVTKAHTMHQLLTYTYGGQSYENLKSDEKIKTLLRVAAGTVSHHHGLQA
jgi:hypothetical protein